MPAKNLDRDVIIAKRMAITTFTVVALFWLIWALSGNSIPSVSAIAHRQAVMKDGQIVTITLSKATGQVVETKKPAAKAAGDSTQALADSTAKDSVAKDSTAVSEAQAEAGETITQTLYRDIFRFPLPFSSPRILDPIFAALMIFLFFRLMNHPKLKGRDSLYGSLAIALIFGGASGIYWSFLVGIVLTALLILTLVVCGAILQLCWKAFSVFYDWVTVANLKSEEASARNLREASKTKS